MPGKASFFCTALVCASPPPPPLPPPPSPSPSPVVVTPPVFTCATHVVVDAYSVYTANSDPPNPDGKVSCWWLDRSKYGCAGYAHLATTGEFAGMMRKCVNHPTNSQRCSIDDASAIRCSTASPSSERGVIPIRQPCCPGIAGVEAPP